MLSRVADAIYWMSRYVERAENLARFIDVTHNLMLDLPPGANEQWKPLIDITGDQSLFAERGDEATHQAVTRFLTFDTEYPNSILSCLQRARDNARSVRETISSETWEHVNQSYLFVADAARSHHGFDLPHELFQEIKLAGHLFQGVIDATMFHNEGWHFARLGRLLERADKTSRIVDVKYFMLLPSVHHVGTPIDDLQWTAVLESVSGFEMYRKRHHGITPERVVDFLLFDGEFPRAIRYCVNAADRSLHAITGVPQDRYANAAEQRLGQLRSEMAYTSISEVISGGLHEFLDGLQTRLNGVDDAVYETFFAIGPRNDGEPQMSERTQA